MEALRQERVTWRHYGKGVSCGGTLNIQLLFNTSAASTFIGAVCLPGFSPPTSTRSANSVASGAEKGVG